MNALAAALRRAAAAFAAAGVLSLGPTVAAAGQDRVVIEIRDFAFVAERQTVSPGDIVVWRNLDIVPHSATASDGSWDSGLIAAGDSWETVVTDDMALAYYCRYHPSMEAALPLVAD